MLFTGRSAGDVGTLYQIKNKFGHRQVSSRVMDCSNHFVDYMNFLTKGLVCVLALDLLRTPDLDTIPAEMQDANNRKNHLENISKKIVDTVWPYPPDIMEQLSQGGDDDDDDWDGEEYCICEPDDEIMNPAMIECSAREHCPGGRWFHGSCKDVDPRDHEDEDWWCSEECKHYTNFCCRDNTKTSPWIGCESGKRCLHGEWFHLHCKELTDVPDGKWYCSLDCQHGIDAVREYSSAATFRGLYHMVEREVERENDGPAMMSMWRINAVDFWQKHHNKYLILSHRLQASINGWLSERLQHELIWNSTANLKGGKGNNVPLDLVNEFLNNEFKENLKHTHGQYTDKQIERSSKLVGTVGRDLEHCYMTQVADKFVAPAKSTTCSYKDDVQKFVNIYTAHGLFDNIPGRHHKSFPNFRNIITLKEPGKLRNRLVKYSAELDSERNILPAFE